MAEIQIKGIGVSDGIRIGKAFIFMNQHSSEDLISDCITDGEVERELNHLSEARENSFNELSKLIEKTKQTLGEDKSTIIQAQQEFLHDPAFFPEIENRIKKNNYPAEKAVIEIVNHFASLFARMDDEYFRERASDIKDLGKRLLLNLSGKKGVSLADINEEIILIADDLTPSDTVLLNKNFILAFLTRIGGKTSHTAILSRSLEIPAILGIGAEIQQISNGDTLIIDGNTGIILINPDNEIIQKYREKIKEELNENIQLKQFIEKPALTIDGFQVEIGANIGTPKEVSNALENGAEGIGLYRTEFLFMDNDHFPTEEEQFEAYKNVAKTMKDKPVIIRTLDIGGDKELSYLDLPKEMNPFLGYRAIRLTLDKKEIMITQLRAILRASVYGKIKIMFPMISNLQEFRQAKEIFEEVQQQLQEEKIPIAKNIELGIMVEIPSVAVLAEQFAKEVDFFSIGTNDLVQYTLAVDRMNERVAHLYDYFHPAVIQLIKRAIDAAHKEGKWTGMCGGMAGDPLAAPLLIGLGLDEWSMDAGSINKVKQVITQLNRPNCQQLIEKILQFGTNEEVRQELELFLFNGRQRTT